jgi:hypothetical protein
MAQRPPLELVVTTFWATRQYVRRIHRKMIMAFHTPVIAEPHHFAAVIDTVMVEILKHLAPPRWVLSVISASSCQRLSLITRIKTLSSRSSRLFIAEGELFQIASNSADHIVDFALR